MRFSLVAAERRSHEAAAISVLVSGITRSNFSPPPSPFFIPLFVCHLLARGAMGFLRSFFPPFARVFRSPIRRPR